MVVSMKSLGIDRLSRDERLNLVTEIWDSIAAEPAPSLLTEAQKKELEKRIAEDDADPDGGIPWEVVKRQSLERLKNS